MTVFRFIIFQRDCKTLSSIYWKYEKVAKSKNCNSWSSLYFFFFLLLHMYTSDNSFVFFEWVLADIRLGHFISAWPSVFHQAQLAFPEFSSVMSRKQGNYCCAFPLFMKSYTLQYRNFRKNFGHVLENNKTMNLSLILPWFNDLYYRWVASP